MQTVDTSEIVTKSYLDQKFDKFAAMIQRGFDSMEKRFDKLEARVAKLEELYSDMHDDILAIKKRLDQIELHLDKLVYQREFTRLEERVTELEKEAARGGKR